ncbi:aspartyl/asparaginyl beta-hydroxylase domain-containing protein [Scytonema sp. PCC 10023]|uniref:aspartyl/asparaginyl beta-hydroxylase domain-containing protein n=1 Tax=Scytonema sp. PCC 10023 TaxID=1680591 RepID=UPI0039C62A5A
MISAKVLSSELVKANYQKGGIKCLRLFNVNDIFFASLKNEIAQLIKQNKPSDVREKKHLSHEATKPFGNSVQFSLLNLSGKFDDPSTDYNRSVLGKRFHQPDTYPNITAFVKAFPRATSMKLLGLGPNSGLTPHKADTIWHSKNACYLELRFHLPIFTNEKAEMLLDNDFYKFEAGSIFLFNQGCVHSAFNFGNEFRYHLTWDMPLSQETFDLMFSDSNVSIPPFLERCLGDEQIVHPYKTEIIKEFEIQGVGKVLYNRFKLHRLGIQPYIFQKLLNEFLYLKYKNRVWVDFVEMRK